MFCQFLEYYFKKGLMPFLQIESGEDSSVSPMSPNDWTPDLSAGNRMSVCSNSSEDTIHSPLCRQLSGCKPLLLQNALCFF